MIGDGDSGDGEIVNNTGATFLNRGPIFDTNVFSLTITNKKGATINTVHRVINEYFNIV